MYVRVEEHLANEYRFDSTEGTVCYHEMRAMWQGEIYDRNCSHGNRDPILGQYVSIDAYHGIGRHLMLCEVRVMATPARGMILFHVCDSLLVFQKSHLSF